MTLSISTESKNSLSVTPESKDSSGKWNSSATRTWADGGTWAQPGTFFAKESKNSLSISNESKT